MLAITCLCLAFISKYIWSRNSVIHFKHFDPFQDEKSGYHQSHYDSSFKAVHFIASMFSTADALFDQKYMDRGVLLVWCCFRGNLSCLHLCDQVWVGSCLEQHDSASLQKAKSLKKLFFHFDVEEHVSCAESPDLNPMKHLWSELKYWLRARSYYQHLCPTSQMPKFPDLNKVPKSWGKPPQKMKTFIAADQCTWIWN